jgi:3-oxoadipate enol-lactonase
MFDSVAIGDGGFDLYYEDVGESPPVVFCHGFSNTHLSWFRNVADLSEDYRCIAPDQRSFGRSVDPTDRGVAALADDLVALLDHLDLERAALVGHSMGGWPVGSVASQHPDRVAGLVLSASPGGLIAPGRHRELMAAGSVADLAESPLPRELEFLDGAIAATNTDSPEEWEDTRAILDEFPLDADAVADDVPTLLVAGEADEFMPAIAVQAVADRLNAESTVVEGAAHSVFYEQPEAFNSRVRTFLDEAAAF